MELTTEISKRSPSAECVANGLMDYAMHSAATLGKAADLARRYGRLFSDRLKVHCEVEGDRATVHVDVGSTAPRPICDFAMSAWFTNHVREPLRDVSGVECWFSYPEPRNRTEYERTFSPATLRFDARCCAFSFARERLDAPLATSDPSFTCSFATTRRLLFNDPANATGWLPKSVTLRTERVCRAGR